MGVPLSPSGNLHTLRVYAYFVEHKKIKFVYAKGHVIFCLCMLRFCPTEGPWLVHSN